MTQAAELRSGKGHHDENFPVASWLVHPRNRGIILAFYEFVRVADDISDHASLSPDEKLAALDRLEKSLLGMGDSDPQGVTLGRQLSERGLATRHAQDLLTAFRMDVTKSCYANWDELIHYCSYSAMPVGRFVLDVHGESRGTWPASDAICAALQIINHLQDCQKDYRNLDRVYIPIDALAAAGADVADLDAPKATPQLRACIQGLARRTRELLREGSMLPHQIRDFRLSLEIAVIHRLADHLVEWLIERDPLSERVHLKKAGFAGLGILAVAKAMLQRPLSRKHRLHPSRVGG